MTEYACNLKSSGLAGLEDLPPYMSPLRGDIERLPERIDTEKIMVEEALRLFGSSTAGKKEAARYLGISVSTLYRRLNRPADAGKAG
jgi:transcriptional regulator of acetoin/glycerol metabolism